MDNFCRDLRITWRIRAEEMVESRPVISGNIKPAIVVLNGCNDVLSLSVVMESIGAD